MGLHQSIAVKHSQDMKCALFMSVKQKLVFRSINTLVRIGTGSLVKLGCKAIIFIPLLFRLFLEIFFVAEDQSSV